jgi:hypothetical protein
MPQEAMATVAPELRAGGAVRVGCSGWNYRDWRGVVYPEALRADQWFDHYRTMFDTVEVNNTFYRLPPVLRLDQLSVVRLHDVHEHLVGGGLDELVQLELGGQLLAVLGALDDEDHGDGDGARRRWRTRPATPPGSRPSPGRPGRRRRRWSPPQPPGSSR